MTKTEMEIAAGDVMRSLGQNGERGEQGREARTQEPRDAGKDDRVVTLSSLLALVVPGLKEASPVHLRWDGSWERRGDTRSDEERK